MKKILASILVLSNILLVQKLTAQSTVSLKDWNTFNQPGYSIQYPKTWELTQAAQMGTSFILFSQLESKQDPFKENINLIIQDLSGHHVDLNTYTEVSEVQIKEMITHSSIIESKRMKSVSGEYHKLIYTGDQGIYHLKYEQYYWVVDNKSYVLTFTTELNKFNDYKEIGEQIMNSFTLKK